MQLKLRQLRVLARNRNKLVVDNLIANHIDRTKKSNHNSERCIICGTTKNLTKEHVIPQWVYESDPDRFFITGMNGIKQTYNKTTVPACDNCNNNLLSSLDKFVSTAIRNVDLKKAFFEETEFEAIILWLELIDYKFQVLNFRRKFLKHHKTIFIEYLKDFPVTMMREGGKSDREVIAELRRSRKRLTIRDKSARYNSLVVIGSKNKDVHFFHQMDEFIFVEFGKNEKAFFYFFKETFDSIEEATEQAMKIVEKHY